MSRVFNLIAAVLDLLSRAAAFLVSYTHGKRSAENEHLRKETEAARRASRIRDRLRSDPSYVDRVRNRFTR